MTTAGTPAVPPSRDAPEAAGDRNDALRFGEVAYSMLRNITPVLLFTIILPIIDSANIKTYFLESRNAFDAFIIGRAWYSLVEGRELFRIDENMDFYRKMAEELSAL